MLLTQLRMSLCQRDHGYAIWKAILGAILELPRSEPGEGQRVT
jgi:hypothetical protein